MAPLRVPLTRLVATAFVLVSTRGHAGPRFGEDTPVSTPPSAGTASPTPVQNAPATPAATPDEAFVPLGTTVLFPYEQKRLLYPRNGSGGLVYVPAGTPHGASLPVVVFLHGMNIDEQVHPWFGPPFGDLRKIAEALVVGGEVAPFILAAPTHTRQATAARVMWPAFDLPGFLDATDKALGDLASVDRERLVIVGHSGAGCNPQGGLFGTSVRDAHPLAILAIDTCVDERVLPEFANVAAAVRFRFYWQRGWRRPVSDLARTCEHCEIDEIDLPPRPNPHNAIVAEALRKALPEFLPPFDRVGERLSGNANAAR